MPANNPVKVWQELKIRGQTLIQREGFTTRPVANKKTSRLQADLDSIDAGTCVEVLVGVGAPMGGHDPANRNCLLPSIRFVHPTLHTD